MRRAIRLTEAVVSNDGLPVLTVGTTGLFNPEGTAVIFSGYAVDGPAVYTSAFIDQIADKVEDIDLSEVPESLFAFDFTGHIPIHGWGLR